MTTRWDDGSFRAVNFQKAVWGFGGIILLAAPLFALTDFVEDRMKVEWRQWLTTKLLDGYYSNRSYYRLHQHELSVDNPDQVCPPNLTFPAFSMTQLCTDKSAFDHPSAKMERNNQTVNLRCACRGSAMMCPPLLRPAPTSSWV